MKTLKTVSEADKKAITAKAEEALRTIQLIAQTRRPTEAESQTARAAYAAAAKVTGK